MDYENGSWWQELDIHNEVTTKVWDGKQDIYHLLHCLVIPRYWWYISSGYLH